MGRENTLHLWSPVNPVHRHIALMPQFYAGACLLKPVAL